MALPELIGVFIAAAAALAWFVKLEDSVRTLQYQYTEVIKSYLHADKAMNAKIARIERALAEKGDYEIYGD